MWQLIECPSLEDGTVSTCQWGVLVPNAFSKKIKINKEDHMVLERVHIGVHSRKEKRGLEGIQKKTHYKNILNSQNIN